ncbi:MAG: ribonuclease HI family protein [Candidatus Levyibacteriota bacterium]
MEKHVSVYCDGGSRGNPGEAAYGFVIYDRDGKELYKEGKRLGITTNNVAEYSAVIAAMHWLLAHPVEDSQIQFYLDSALVANQMKGIFKIKNENMRSLAYTAKTLEKKLSQQITYHAIPREQNKMADRMVNLALDNLL